MLLSSSDLGACLKALDAVGEAAASGADFARQGVASLKGLVGSELTHLSICDLHASHRSVVSDAPGAISRRQIETFDRHFDRHPLVRAHAGNRCAVTRRISELVPGGQFRRTDLYNDYYREIAIEDAMAVPVHVEGPLLVSFVFNRSRRAFDDRERARMEAIRPHLASLYRLSRAMDMARSPQWSPSPDTGRLTAREQEVMRWLSGGKTDRDIAEILGISPRTVHKHLQRIYEKLGVETRTAAVVRALDRR
jgi:DNA-binding CsgD family transcriptional regulator